MLRSITTHAFFLASIGTLAVLGGCGAPGPAGPMPEATASGPTNAQLLKNIIDDSIKMPEGELKTYLDQRICGGSYFTAALSGIGGISKSADMARSDAALSQSEGDSGTALNEFEAADSVDEVALADYFRLADEAIVINCKDDARAAYENVINIYVGTDYTGYRDKARLGLENLDRTQN